MTLDTLRTATGGIPPVVPQPREWCESCGRHCSYRPGGPCEDCHARRIARLAVSAAVVLGGESSPAQYEDRTDWGVRTRYADLRRQIDSTGEPFRSAPIRRRRYKHD